MRRFLLIGLLLLVSTGAFAIDPTHIWSLQWPPGSGTEVVYVTKDGNLYIAGTLAATSVTPSPTYSNDSGIDTATAVPLVLGPTHATAVTCAHPFNQSAGVCNLNANSNYAVNVATGSSTGTVTVGGTGTQAIHVGDGAGVKTVTVGSTNTSSALTLQSGTGDVICTSTDDISITAADDLTLNGGSAGSVITIGGNVDGNVVNVCTDDTAADTVSIGSAKDTIAIAGQNVTVGTFSGTANVVIQSGSGDVLIKSTDDILLTTNSGTGENIALTNTQGTAENAIALQAVAGGVDIDCAAAKDIDIAGGQVKLSSKDNAAGAISLTANTGTSETITITNTQGTSASAISITAAAGGIALNGNTAVVGSLTTTVPTAFDYLLSSTPLVDVGALAATTIFTVPTGKSAVITKIVIRNASGTFNQATDPIFSIGWNSTDYNDVVASATYTYPTAATAYKILSPIANEATVGTTGQTLKINVTTAATASTTCTISVFGYVF